MSTRLWSMSSCRQQRTNRLPVNRINSSSTFLITRHNCSRMRRFAKSSLTDSFNAQYSQNSTLPQPMFKCLTSNIIKPHQPMKPRVVWSSTPDRSETWRHLADASAQEVSLISSSPTSNLSHPQATPPSICEEVVKYKNIPLPLNSPCLNLLYQRPMALAENWLWSRQQTHHQLSRWKIATSLIKSLAVLVAV